MVKLKAHQLPLLIRDRRRQYWYWVSNSVIDLYGQFIGPLALAVYACLCRFADYNDQVAWPSIKTVALLIGTGHNQVRRELKKLEAMGLIATEVRNGRANTYFLLEPGCDLTEITERYDALKKGKARIVPTPTRTDTPLSLGRGPLPAQIPEQEYIAGVDISIPIDQQQHIKEREKNEITRALLDFGVDCDVVDELLNNEPPAPVVTLKEVEGWIAYASAESVRLRNPPGFVVDRLRKGADPPPARIRRGSKEDRYRYFRGEYADLVEH